MRVVCAAATRGVGMWITRETGRHGANVRGLTGWQADGKPDSDHPTPHCQTDRDSLVTPLLLSLVSCSSRSPSLLRVSLLSRRPAVSFFTRLPCSWPAVLSRSPTWEDFMVKRSFVSWLTRLALRTNGIKILLSESCRFCPSRAARLLAASILIVRHGELYLIDRRLMRSWHVTVRDMHVNNIITP